MQYFRDNLLSVKRGVIVHGCNAQGVFGSGVAKAIKDKYPEAFKKYTIDLELFKMTLGDLSLYKYSEELTIVSAITQQFYGRDANVRYVSYDAVDRAFDKIFSSTDDQYAVSLPKIGAGLGNGVWKVIEEIILGNAHKNRFNSDKIHVYILHATKELT